MKFELFPPGVTPTNKSKDAEQQNGEEQDTLSSDGSSKGGVMPIEKLKVHGNQLTHQKLSPPSSPHPPQTATTVQEPTSEQYLPPPTTSSSKQPSMLRRYEFIRRSLTRTGEKPCSPTFVIEGKKVTHKQPLQPNGEANTNGLQQNDHPDDFKLDFDPIAFLENKMKPPYRAALPPKPKTEGGIPTKSSATSVVLPVLHIEGPGFSHQLKSKSSSLPGDDQPEVEDMATETSAAQSESIWAELENLDQRHHRAIKKNNFFSTAGTRIGEDHSELCVENSHKSKATITLQLQTGPTSHNDKPKMSGPNSAVISQQQLSRKQSKSPRDKLYRSATHIATGSRPLFQSVNSYLNFNNRRTGLYSSEQYLDSTRYDNPLKPLENNLKRPISKKLVAKYSDMEIQRELNDFFKIRSVK